MKKRISLNKHGEANKPTPPPPCWIAFLIWTSTHKKLKVTNCLKPRKQQQQEEKRLVFFSLHQVVVVTSARDSVQGSQPDLLSFSVYLSFFSFLFCYFQPENPTCSTVTTFGITTEDVVLKRQNELGLFFFFFFTFPEKNVVRISSLIA
jgi:hypothetical protein